MFTRDEVLELINDDHSDTLFECFECGKNVSISLHVGYQICRNCSIELVESRRYI